ncbi:MAG: colanic acid biosynthesis acetyltransferase WcaF [Gammaproteobacteria bacterium]|nr:colanic acid biosynthesis acetyltransferase WcaF [Gammaproteobacteria bacterium]
MSDTKVDLSGYDRGDYHPGRGVFIRTLWYCLNALLMDSWLCPVSSIKCRLLKMFGAKVGRAVVVKPRVNIKYPWHLELGNHVWLGEGVWIDNLTSVRIASNVCLSQGSYLLTGNHNYKKSTFPLMVAGIEIEAGAWVGANAVVCPGVKIGEGAVLCVGSVLASNAEAMTIYRGNPADKVRRREIVS